MLWLVTCGHVPPLRGCLNVADHRPIATKIYCSLLVQRAVLSRFERLFEFCFLHVANTGQRNYPPFCPAVRGIFVLGAAFIRSVCENSDITRLSETNSTYGIESRTSAQLSVAGLVMCTVRRSAVRLSCKRSFSGVGFHVMSMSRANVAWPLDESSCQWRIQRLGLL